MGCVSRPNWLGDNERVPEFYNYSQRQHAFYAAVHNAYLKEFDGFDLFHPRHDYSHAIWKHSPGDDRPGKSEFSSFGEVHEARREFINRYRSDIEVHKKSRFSEDMPHNSKVYTFVFERNSLGWHEITGYPNER